MKALQIALIVAGLAGLAAMGACHPSPPVNGPDADAAPAPHPVVHADCGLAAKHYSAVCNTADTDATAGDCQAQVQNNGGYSDCLMATKNCSDGTACDNKAGAFLPHPKKPPVNGH